MKTTPLYINISLFCILLLSCHNKNNKQNTLVLTNEADSIGYYTGIFTAYTLKNLGDTTINADIFYKALTGAMNEKETGVTKTDANYNLGFYFDKLRKKLKEKNIKAGNEFMAKNKLREGIFTTSSGLQYEIINEGSGRKLQENDTVFVHFKGFSVDGRLLMDSFTGEKPVKLAANGNEMPGLYETIRLMKTGARYIAYIPFNLSFADSTMIMDDHENGLPVIVEIELVGVKDK